MKKRVLEKLKSNCGDYVSGEALSVNLGVSRTAVWKYIKDLKEEGYSIDAVSRKGYRLISDEDILNSFEITYQLTTKVLGKEASYFEEIDSTNNYAKKLAYEGCPDGTVVVADRQVAGKGRLGRAWESPAGKGIWMSVVLRPSIPPEDVQVITLGASVAVVKALKVFAGEGLGIKWPNDIVFGGKKICGILTEMSSEQDKINFIVVGMGINVSHQAEDFSEDLRNRATSLLLCRDSSDGGGKKRSGETSLRRSEILRNILAELEEVYFKINEGHFTDIIAQWKRFSATLGKEVRVVIKGIEYAGLAKDITADGKLVVECADGERREVISGEVIVRGMLGYV